MVAWPTNTGHNARVTDPIADVVAARDAYVAARQQVPETRLALGKAILEARDRKVSQVDIAKALELSREQVRRYEAEYVDSTTLVVAACGS